MGVTALFDEPQVPARPKLPLDYLNKLGRAAPTAHPLKLRARPSSEPPIEQSIESSLKSIERVVENYGAMKDNVQYYRILSEQHEAALESERASYQELSRRLDEAQRECDSVRSQLRDESQRLAEANACATALESLVKSMEEENSALRAQTMRLIQGVEILIAAENRLHIDGR